VEGATLKFPNHTNSEDQEFIPPPTLHKKRQLTPYGAAHLPRTQGALDTYTDLGVFVHPDRALSLGLISGVEMGIFPRLSVPTR